MSETTRNRIVVGVDGSTESIKALGWAARFARVEPDAEILAVIAWEYPAYYGWSAAGAYAIPELNPKEMARSALDDAIDSAFGEARPAHLSIEVVQGNAAKILIDRSRDAMLLVLGSRGHGGFSGLLLGSVSMNCAEHATCPVLVVHSDAHDRAEG